MPGAGDRRVVTYTPDAAGRLYSLSSNATTYAPAASVSSIGYAAQNALNTETYGNNLIHAVTYNNRLQPNEIKLGTSGAPTSIVDLVYSYGTTNNSGNVQSIAYSGGGLNYTQTFGYDTLNRLTTSQENSGSSWSQTNAYDRYGNRWVDLGGGNQSLYINTSDNRITGWSYDSAGNLLNDGNHSYTYDAENKIRTVDSQTAYVYDGEGQRVRKLLGENSRFVYGISGNEIAEFDGSTGALKKEYIYGANGLVATIEPTSVNSNGTRYATSDHLGSARIVTSSSASVVSRHDYMPFGDELGSGVGGRTTGIGFGVSDGQRQKFTQKERDNDTGLDYFGARYYASTQGRFTSPDNIAFSKGTNPQSWNLYDYTSNNPLNRVDKNGRDWFQIGEGYGARFEWYKGKKHTYKDAEGKDHEAKNVGRYLLVVVKTGEQNSDKAETVRVTLYDQNRVVAQNTQGFSGGEPGSRPIPTGVYHMNLYLRGEAKDSDNDRYLDKNAGLQTVPPEFQGPWGTRRAALEPWSANLDPQYVGNYLHGHLKERSTTIGCVCDRSETVLDAVFNINFKETPTVRAVVTDGLPKSGDPKPGPYVIFPE